MDDVIKQASGLYLSDDYKEVKDVHVCSRYYCTYGMIHNEWYRESLAVLERDIVRTIYQVLISWLTKPFFRDKVTISGHLSLTTLLRML